MASMVASSRAAPGTASRRSGVGAFGDDGVQRRTRAWRDNDDLCGADVYPDAAPCVPYEATH